MLPTSRRSCNRRVTDFQAELLTQYSRLQNFRVTPAPGSVRIECEDDLWRHYSLDRFFMSHFLTEDNSTCIHPIAPGTPLSAPGWGGAYAGSKVRCVAAHDQRPFAQPDHCSRYHPGTSFVPFDAFPTAHPKDPTDWRKTG